VCVCEVEWKVSEGHTDVEGGAASSACTSPTMTRDYRVHDSCCFSFCLSSATRRRPTEGENSALWCSDVDL